jgi:hypothetical protein
VAKRVVERTGTWMKRPGATSRFDAVLSRSLEDFGAVLCIAEMAGAGTSCYKAGTCEGKRRQG